MAPGEGRGHPTLQSRQQHPQQESHGVGEEPSSTCKHTVCPVQGGESRARATGQEAARWCLGGLTRALGACVHPGP